MAAIPSTAVLFGISPMTSRMPRVLYKYVLADHAAAMVKYGRIRVGTLFDFRREEDHGRQIGDAREGSVVTTERRDPSLTPAQRGPSPLADRIFNNVPGYRIANFGAEFSVEEAAGNCFVYCVSEKLSSALMKEMGKDSVVRIADASVFVRAVDAAVRRQHPGLLAVEAQSCLYEFRDRDASQPLIDSIFVKDPVLYGHQAEFRLCWRGSVGKGEALFVASRDIAACCELVPSDSAPALENA